MMRGFMLILLIAWSIGIGVRFVFEYPNPVSYQMNAFDLWTDWIPLALLGIINLIIFPAKDRKNIFGDRR